MITDHIMASIADLAQEVSQYFVSLEWERVGAMRSCDASERLLTLDLNDTDWIAGEGGYYYYRGSVDPKTATSKLFNHVTFS